MPFNTIHFSDPLDISIIPQFTSTVKHLVKAGENLSKGQAVYVTGSTGQSGTNMIVGKASNVAEMSSSKTLGIMEQSLSANQSGYVVTEGLLSGINTASASAGDPIWLGSNGSLIFGLTNKPFAPNHLVYLGVVTRSQQNNGEIFVHVQNGFELQELHNVQISSAQDGDILVYDGASGLWKNSGINGGSA